MYNFQVVIFDLIGTLVKMNTVSDVAVTNAQLYDGVIEMLNTLKDEGYILCICTNNSKEVLDIILSHFNLEQYFHYRKSYVRGLDKQQLIKQLLDETSVCSAIVVGDTRIHFEAADMTRCISIGIKRVDECFLADFTAQQSSDIPGIIHKINGMYQSIAEQILMKKQKNKPIIVGINGVDTSGKSLLTKELSRYLSKMGFRNQVIAIDDFHNPSIVRNKEENPINSYLNNAFNISKIESELLKPIVTEGRLHKELVLLNLVTDEFTNIKNYDIDEHTIVLLEGVLIFRETLNPYFDLRIFVKISFDEVLKRASLRDSYLLGDSVIKKYKEKYIPIQEKYLAQYDPEMISDIVIDNNDYMMPKLQLKSKFSLLTMPLRR